MSALWNSFQVHPVLGKRALKSSLLTNRCLCEAVCTYDFATGGCEVYDTASRNGTLVNRKLVNRDPIFPGDVLYLVGHRFLIDWVGPKGEVYDDPVTEQETSCLSGLSPTG